MEAALQLAPAITEADRHLHVLAAPQIGGRHLQAGQDLPTIGNAGVKGCRRLILGLRHELDAVERNIDAGRGFQVRTVERVLGLIGARHQLPGLATLGVGIVDPAAGFVARFLGFPGQHRRVGALWQALGRESLANDGVRQAGDTGPDPAGRAGEHKKAGQDGGSAQKHGAILLRNARTDQRCSLSGGSVA